MTHAPIAIGTRFATDAEVQHFHRLCQQSNVDPHSDVVVDLPSGTSMRRLDVRNAHERRMIWYALARAWGAAAEVGKGGDHGHTMRHSASVASRRSAPPTSRPGATCADPSGRVRTIASAHRAVPILRRWAVSASSSTAPHALASAYQIIRRSCALRTSSRRSGVPDGRSTTTSL